MTDLESHIPILDDRSALFLDVDGTLLDIAPTPTSVVVPPDLPEVLLRLSTMVGGALAVVSGRTLADIDRLLRPARLPAAGQHGLERRDPDGALHRFESDPGRLVPARRRLEAFVQAWPGTMLEDKGDSVAVHFRNAPEAAPEAARVTSELIESLRDGYRLLHGKSVIELQPDAASKGRAIDRFMSQSPFHGRRPIFIGDDVTDESGFEAVNALGGHSVRIDGATPLVSTHARLRLPDPTALRNWLRRLAGFQPA